MFILLYITLMVTVGFLGVLQTFFVIPHAVVAESDWHVFVKSILSTIELGPENLHVINYDSSPINTFRFHKLPVISQYVFSEDPLPKYRIDYLETRVSNHLDIPSILDKLHESNYRNMVTTLHNRILGK